MDPTKQAMLVNPAFANYGVPYGYRMTEWLFGDKNSNPYWDQPEKWGHSGRVAFLDRTVTFLAVPAAAVPGPPTTPSTVSQSVNFGGGKNVIVFCRQASVVLTTAPGAGSGFASLPNETASYVHAQIQRQSGFIDVEMAPIQNNFGFGWRPNIRPVPELWLGNESRAITISNFSNEIVNVSLTFTLALLDTGR